MATHHGVVHFELPADDPQKLSDFYSGLFGWNIMKMSMDGGDYWGVSTGPAGEDGMPSEPGYIGGGITKRMMPDQTPANYVQVESVEEYAKKAQQMGAQLLIPKSPVPAMGWFALLKDPEGNPLGLWQIDPSAK
jgi:predicted enzyme related to lactoylglutathione lyase